MVTCDKNTEMALEDTRSLTITSTDTEQMDNWMHQHTRPVLDTDRN